MEGNIRYSQGMGGYYTKREREKATLPCTLSIIHFKECENEDAVTLGKLRSDFRVKHHNTIYDVTTSFAFLWNEEHTTTFLLILNKLQLYLLKLIEGL